MNPSFLMNWRNLRDHNNMEERGYPYRTPNVFMTFLAKLMAMYSIPFRSLKEILGIFARIAIRGRNLRSKWNRKRRRWSKLHAMISINDVSVISFMITDKHVHGTKSDKEFMKCGGD